MSKHFHFAAYVKVKVHTLDVGPLLVSSPQKRSGMARILKGSQQFYLNTHTSNPQSE